MCSIGALFQPRRVFTCAVYVQKNDVDVEKFMSILRPSALYAPTFDKKLARMLDRDFSNPNFPTKHLLKDVKLFASEAEGVQIDTALLKGLETVIQATVARGLDFTDYSAVCFPRFPPHLWLVRCLHA
jgi:3-hydroxyisobutyrate dehydrogenase